MKPKTLSLDYNAAENVTCKAYGNNAQVQWLRKMTVDGEVKLDPVPTEKVSGKMTRTNTGYIEKKYIMALRNVTPKDTGTYICKVTVNGKPAFSDLQLTVEGTKAFWVVSYFLYYTLLYFTGTKLQMVIVGKYIKQYMMSLFHT